MDNILSYFGLVDARISTSEKDLPVPQLNPLLKKQTLLKFMLWPVSVMRSQGLVQPCRQVLLQHQLNQFQLHPLLLLRGDPTSSSVWELQMQKIMCLNLKDCFWTKIWNLNKILTRLKEKWQTQMDSFSR